MRAKLLGMRENQMILLLTTELQQQVVKISQQHSFISKMTYDLSKLGQTDLVLVCDQSSSQHSYSSKMTYELSKLGQIDLVLVCEQSSLVGRCMQDYKSLHCEA